MKIDPSTVHLCVDMQRLFVERTEWAMPWAPRVLPQIVEIACHHAARTIFTRFMPPQAPEQMHGTWRGYYRRWQAFTRARLDERLLDLMPPLQALVPPAEIVDKRFYSGFSGTGLATRLAEKGARSIVVTGGETDVCVLATTLAAVDRGFAVILATDALCSAADATHDALIKLYRERFTEQIETATTDEILSAWNLA
jgi:nicotinamidase-related amidase